MKLSYAWSKPISRFLIVLKLTAIVRQHTHSNLNLDPLLFFVAFRGYYQSFESVINLVYIHNDTVLDD